MPGFFSLSNIADHGAILPALILSTEALLMVLSLSCYQPLDTYSTSSIATGAVLSVVIVVCLFHDFHPGLMRLLGLVLRLHRCHLAIALAGADSKNLGSVSHALMVQSGLASVAIVSLALVHHSWLWQVCQQGVLALMLFTWIAKSCTATPKQQQLCPSGFLQSSLFSSSAYCLTHAPFWLARSPALGSAHLPCSLHVLWVVSNWVLVLPLTLSVSLHFSGVRARRACSRVSS